MPYSFLDGRHYNVSVEFISQYKMDEVEAVKDPPSAKPPSTPHENTPKKKRQMSCMNCRDKKIKVRAYCSFTCP